MNEDLSLGTSQSVRRAIIIELRLHGIEEWPDAAGRQIPARLIARHNGSGERAIQPFARLVRENGGCVTVDMPSDWKPYQGPSPPVVARDNRDFRA